MKTLVSTGLSLGVLVVLGVGAAQAAPGVTLNGQPLALSASPQQINGRTLVPMRDVFEALGAPVEWNATAQLITARRGDTQIQLGINNPIALVNGRNVSLDQPATLIDGRTFVPLRFVAEATGARVDYNSALQLVSIRSPLASVAQNPFPALPSLPNYNTSTQPDVQAQVGGFRQISVPSGVVVPVALDRALSSSTTRVGERFTASVVSRRLGDSEFPAGTKIEAVVTEARPGSKGEPGVLDFEFQTAVLPSGDRVPLRGQLASLDTQSVQDQNGRLVASGARKDDRLKVIGIGAGAGFVLGRVLKADSTLSTILGAAGGYLFSRSRNRKAQEATLAANTTLGVELLDAVSYRDEGDYQRSRGAFLLGTKPNRVASDYGFDESTAVRPTDSYEGYEVSDRLPLPAPARVDDTTGDVVDNEFEDARANEAQTIAIPAGAVVPVTLDAEVSSTTARVGDEVLASVETRREGDSEFPSGTKLSGRVVEARARRGDTPGVLDIEWRQAVLPSGERIALSGQLVGLDTESVQSVDGRIVAKRGSSNKNRLKIIGIGAAAGFVLGRVLDKEGLLPGLIGALGGYVFGARQSDKPADARLAAGTRLGVRLDERVAYNSDDYYQVRANYLRLN